MTNPTPFEAILNARYSRRAFVGGAAKGVAALSATTALSGCLGEDKHLSTLTFKQVPAGLDEMHHVAEGYETQIVMRWGDALFDDSPAFNPQQQSALSQSKQFGFNNDFIAYFPLSKEAPSQHGLLCVNHEYTSAELLFDNLPDRKIAYELLSDEQNRIEMAAHGVSVVEMREEEGQWQAQMGKYNRRITATTPILIGGPAAGHKRMQTSADPTGEEILGTFGNCAGGMTPWGTYLTCEENIDVYFKLGNYSGAELANHKAMTLGTRMYHRWDKTDDRFDVEKTPNEPNRFGWVVEIDPFHPESKPIKRTALGRMKHECASTTLSKDGRLVVYMGDDQAFEHIYKFVSAKKFDPDNRLANAHLLDDGTLYVARFDADGTTAWLPLVHGENGLDSSNGFDSQADVVIEARRAAKLMGATPMDRPEDVEVNPVSGHIFACMTKNPLRTKGDYLNKRAPDPMGYVLEIMEKGEDHAALSGHWRLFLEGGNPQETAYRKGNYLADVSDDGWLACPDNMAFDPQGRIWITTDGQPEAVGKADAIYAADTRGDGRGITRCFFRGPVGCEMTGPCFAPDGKTLFVSVQHPSEGSSFMKPSTRWPDFDKNMPARPAVVAIRKNDGGEIGGYSRSK